jgi:hypothetical protein
MSQEAVPIVRTQHKGKLGEQVRRIADQLKQETDLQIKATSRSFMKSSIWLRKT